MIFGVGVRVRRKRSDAEDEWGGGKAGRESRQSRLREGNEDRCGSNDWRSVDDGDVLGVFKIPLGGVRASWLFRGFVFVEGALRGVLHGIVRDGDTFRAALHAHENEQDTKGGNRAPELHYILDNSERDEVSVICLDGRYGFCRRERL